MEIQPIQMPISLTQGMIQPIASLATDAAKNMAEVAPSNFKDLLKQAMTDLNVSQSDPSAVVSLATGGEENLHDVMISLQKASMTLQYAIAIRNKVLDSYQAVIQMQI